MKLKIAGVCAGIVTLLVVAWTLYSWGKWERDHWLQLLALKTEAEQLASKKEYEQAAGKYGEMFRLLGDRELSSSYVRSEIDAARIAAAKNEERVNAILARRAEAERLRREQLTLVERASREQRAQAAAAVREAEVRREQEARSKEVTFLTSIGVSEFLSQRIVHQPAGPTLLKFQAISDGMDLFEVQYILGSGELAASSGNLAIYNWTQSGTFGGNMSVTFRDRKVVSKAQAGLE